MPLVSYHKAGAVATITMDDGKVNALSRAMFAELNAAFEQAAADRAVVLLTGRDGVFSAGFDLAVLRAGGVESDAMVQDGFLLAQRMLSFPLPIAIACPGHAIAMGAFLLLSADYRVGAAGAYKFAANEVAIGLTVPRAAVEIVRQRLTPAAFNRAVVLAETFSPDNAVEAGFLDRVVPARDLMKVVGAVTAAMAGLDLDAHAEAKARVRGPALEALRSAIAADFAGVQSPA
jgi:enoyl-CoA hydratase